MLWHAPPTRYGPVCGPGTMPVRLVMASALLLPGLALAAGNRFAMSATASIHPTAATAQTDGGFQLKATFAATPANPQASAGYSLTARVVAQALDCTSDTIFEDGFDG